MRFLCGQCESRVRIGEEKLADIGYYLKRPIKSGREYLEEDKLQFT